MMLGGGEDETRSQANIVGEGGTQGAQCGTPSLPYE